MRINYLSFLLLLILIAACNQNNNKYYSDGSTETEVIDNRDKLDSILRFMFETDFTLNKVFIVDSTQQMKISKSRLHKFNKHEFDIINDSIIYAFNRLNHKKEEIGTLLNMVGFRKGSSSDLLYNNSFGWEYVNDNLGIDAIVEISTPIYFTRENQDYVFIYISSIQSGAVGYGAFYLIQIKEDGFEIIKEFADYII